MLHITTRKNAQAPKQYPVIVYTPIITVISVSPIIHPSIHPSNGGATKRRVDVAVARICIKVVVRSSTYRHLGYTDRGM